MTRRNRIEGDLTVTGTVVPGNIILPAAVVTDSNVSAVAKIAASKLVHRHVIQHSVASGSAVTSQTLPIYIARAAARLTELRAVLTQVPTGNYTVTVDIERSTGGGAFATMFTVPLVLDSSSVVRVPEYTEPDSYDLLADDVLRLVITAAGSSGAQGQGLVVSLTVDEDPS